MQYLKSPLTIMPLLTALGTSISHATTNTSGSIYGQAKNNAAITFKSEATGLSRQVNADAQGRFSFNGVPVGRYIVSSSHGGSKIVIVTIGTGSPVNFDDKHMEVISITGAQLSAIDTSSAESTMVFTEQQIERLPIGRSTLAIALLTPGTAVGGSAAFAGLPSFGGASVAENGYYINGFDVTNIRKFTSFASLPFDAVKQTQVKTGGYGAEFGRSLGGVINTISKSGTNQWQFAAAAIYAPQTLRATLKDSMSREQGSQNRNIYNSDNQTDRLSYNIAAGGPLIKDKLFVYANVEFKDNEYHSYYRQSSQTLNGNSPRGIARLDWHITDDHLLSATYINTSSEWEYLKYQNDKDSEGKTLLYTGEHGAQTADYSVNYGGDIYIVNYHGQLNERLGIDLMVGQLQSLQADRDPRLLDVSAAACPRSWVTGGNGSWSKREYIGCHNTAQYSILDPLAGAARDERQSVKIDFDYTLDHHLIRFGYNLEQFNTYTVGTQYTGGIYHRFYQANDDNNLKINDVELTDGQWVVRSRTSTVESGQFKVQNSAFYIEDHWQVTDELMIYTGLRNETFTNYAADGQVFVEADTLLAPRLGFSWDIEGDHSKKLFSTLGRYFIPIASNTNYSMTRYRYATDAYYLVDGWDDASGKPVYSGMVGEHGAQVGHAGFAEQRPDPRVLAAQNLSPMYQDELILGYQQRLNNHWSAGIKSVHRRIGDGMDDYCGNDGFYQWAADQGFALPNEENGWVTPQGGFDPADLSACVLLNPGRDLDIYIDTNSDGNVTLEKIPNRYFGLPKYQRKYHALTLSLNKSMADDWYSSMSYTWSHSYGNSEGYVNTTQNQDSPGTTRDFDHLRYTEGAYGDLPNDHRHSIKFYGGYNLTDEWLFTVNARAQSGIPLNATGYIPLDNLLVGDNSSDYDYNMFKNAGGSSFYTRDENGEHQLGSRGDQGRADWIYTFDAGLRYQPHWAEQKLTFKMEIFNALNLNREIRWYQQADISRSNENQNPNHLAPRALQTPRAVRLSVRYKF
ncbi:MAG: hypothetical protein ACI8WB_003872 [Phenylobacterium sp.]|jgi:hypothetical protein